MAHQRRDDDFTTWVIAALGWISAGVWLIRLPLPLLIRVALVAGAGLLLVRLAEARILRNRLRTPPRRPTRRE